MSRRQRRSITVMACCYRFHETRLWLSPKYRRVDFESIKVVLSTVIVGKKTIILLKIFALFDFGSAKANKRGLSCRKPWAKTQTELLDLNKRQEAHREGSMRKLQLWSRLNLSEVGKLAWQFATDMGEMRTWFLTVVRLCFFSFFGPFEGS